MGAWTLVIVAAVIGTYAAVSRRLASTPVTAAIVFVAAGLLFGYAGLDWIKLGFDERSVSTLAVGREPHGLTVWPQPGRYSLGHTGNMR